MLLALVLSALPSLSLPATVTRLPNGLTVIISPDHSVPGVSVDIWYHVGSKDEEPGRTGFAHLFEHLMFMGARHVPYPQFDTIMESGGGTNNAQTGNDTTHYYEAGPSNLLETFLWMESDRMATLGLTMTPEKLETQRKIVLNERRQSYEARPYGTADLAIFDNLFPEGHPYHWPVIGSAKDIEAARLDDVKRFFARWYVPTNATLAIVGDVDVAQTQKLVEKYFGWLPSKPMPPHAQAAPVTLTTEKRVQLTDKVELPKLVLVWLSPAAGKPGDAESDLLARVLGGGKSSRLYEELVHQKELATEISVGQQSLELQSVFEIDALARPGHTPAELRAAIDGVIAKLLAEGPTAEEINSARTDLYTSLARSLEGLLPRGELLNQFQLMYGDAGALGKELARYEAVTPQSALEVARHVLGPGRVVIEVLPEAGASPSAGGAR